MSSRKWRSIMKKKQTVTVLPIIMDTEEGPGEKLVNLEELV